MSSNLDDDQDIRTVLETLAARRVPSAPDHQGLRAGIRRHRAQRWLAVGGVGLAVAAAVVVPALTLNGHSDVAARPPGVSHTAASTAPSSPSSNTPSNQVTSTGADEYPPISDEIIATLANRGTEVTIKSGSDTEVSVEEAIGAARAGGYPELQPDQISASLAVVTTHKIGTEQQMDPTKPSNIKPMIDHQQIWIIAFHGIPERIISPRQGASTPTGLSFVDVVQFITSDSPATLLLGTSL